MYKQTDTYRRQVRDEDYFLNLRKEVAALDQPNRVFDFRVLTSEGDTADEMASLWEQKAEADGFLLEKHSRSLCFRPCSPDFVPSDAPGSTDKRDMPQQPLVSAPNYPSELHIVPLGPTAQFAIYANSEDKEARSRNYIRVGQPGYLQEYRERASKLGSSCLSYFNSLFGRLHIVQHLATKEKIRWTDSEVAHLTNGLNSIVECFNPASPHFRSDLLDVFLGNHTRAGDSAVGFIGLVAAHGGKRTFWEDGVHKEMATTRRVFDILYSISEFLKVFTTFFERETVRRMLGASLYDLPSTACLMTMEDWYFCTQRLVILPKNPRRLFVLEFYQNGVCLGVVAFIGTEHRVKLRPGEFALTEADYGLVPVTKRIQAGPAEARTKEVAAKDQIPTKTSLKEHQAQHASAVKLAQKVAEREKEIQAEEESLRRAFDVKPDSLTEKEKKLLYEFYQTKLDEEIYTRIVEDTEFLTQVQKVSAWAREAASSIEARRSSPSNPLLTTLDSSAEVKAEQSRLYHQAIVEFQDRVFEGQPRFRTNLASLQKKMNEMSLVPTYSCVDQFWSILRKNCENIMGCENCRGCHRILARRCPCLRVFLERREEHSQEASEDGERPCWDERFVACFRCRVYNEELGRQELPEDYLIDSDTQLCDCMETWIRVLDVENQSPVYCRVCATVQPCCLEDRLSRLNGTKQSCKSRL